MNYDLIPTYYNDDGSSSSEESAVVDKDVLEILTTRERVEEEINPSGNPVYVSLSNVDQGDRAVLRISGMSLVCMFVINCKTT